MFKSVIYIIGLACLLTFANTEVNDESETDLNDLAAQSDAVKVNKCCEPNELMVDGKCRLAEHVNSSTWVPEFTDLNSLEPTTVKYYKFINGIPACSTTQQTPIFHSPNSEDRLVLLSNGILRHYIYHTHPITDDDVKSVLQFEPYGSSLHEPISIGNNQEETSYYDYVQGKYCMDKNIATQNNETSVSLCALVCIPEVKINWSDTDFLMRKILNPIFHSIAMIIYLSVAIIYFVLPTLRDLAGNIITTINVCLIVSQAADLVRTFTEFSSHVSFMVADVVLYVSLLAAFFWLNSFGFYIWKTFKSRNVFLRVTDVRKYCYYSCFAWSCTIFMAALAIFGHFFLDSGASPNRKMTKHFSSSIIADEDQETIGWLGIAIFFTPVAFIIIVNVFFYVTTQNIIKRVTTYGRIHYKLKRSFYLFLHLFLIMTFSWLFLLLSWLHFDGLFYTHVIVNLLQSILVLYVCVLRQSHITFLLRKSCCYAEPVPTGEWGDEMTHMNGNYIY